MTQDEEGRAPATIAYMAISSSACFFPEDDDPVNFDGETITWTFELLKEAACGPGLYRLEFVRALTAEERSAKAATLLEAEEPASPGHRTEAQAKLREAPTAVLRNALHQIVHLRPLGDVERCVGARKLVEQMERIALTALRDTQP